MKLHIFLLIAFIFCLTVNVAVAAVAALGLTAVAEFPPFDPNKPRTPRFGDVNAAIFKEEPTGFVARRRSTHRPSLIKRFRKNLRCLVPRLKDRIGINSNEIPHHGYGK